MTIEIQHDVPLTSASHSQRGEIIEAFKQMQIGDSFFYPNQTDSFRGHCYWAAAYAGIKVTIRQRTENEIAGVRIWRIAKDDEQAREEGVK